MTKKNVHLGFSALLIAMLAGCSASNTFNDSGTNGATISCSSNCTPVQLAVDNIQNLNYTCGSVRDVTNNLGLASCPVGTVINYFIQSPSLTAKSKIELGSYSIPSAVAAGKIVRITPFDLSGAVADSSGLNATAINITRLLISLKALPYVSNLPINKIDITDAKKNLIDTVYPEKTIPLSTFTTDATFIATFTPWINAIASSTTPNGSYELASYDTAKTQLERGLRVIKAGIYYGSPVTSFTNVSNSSAVSLGISGSGGAGTNTTMGIYVLADRDGSSIGQGLNWSGVPETGKLMYLDKRFTKMMPSAGSNPRFNIFNNKVETFKWDILGTNNQFEMTSGRLINDSVVAGNDTLYKLYTYTPVSSIVNSSELGNWSITGSTPFTGTATLMKGFVVDNFLDPDVWKTIDNVASTKAYVFPLNTTLSFNYGAAIAEVPATSTSSAIPAIPAKSGCPSAGCLLQNQAITILANGNIVSDMNSDCSAVDPATLKDASGNQEYRVGVVRTAYTNTANDAFVSLALLLSGSQFGALDGLHVGTEVMAPLSKLNIKALIDSPTGQGSISFTDSSTAATLESGSNPARWGNVYNGYTKLYDVYKTKAGSTVVYSDEAYKSEGTVTAAMTACPAGTPNWPHIKP